MQDKQNATPRYNIVKLQNTKEKEKILKSAGGS